MEKILKNRYVISYVLVHVFFFTQRLFSGTNEAKDFLWIVSYTQIKYCLQIGWTIGLQIMDYLHELNLSFKASYG